MVRMPFGRHKGRLLEDIDSWYLEWVYTTARAASPSLKAASLRELNRRGEAHAPPGRDVALAPEVLQAWFREMTLRYHPDRGGSKEAMQAINHGYDRLRELAGVA